MNRRSPHVPWIAALVLLIGSSGCMGGNDGTNPTKVKAEVARKADARKDRADAVRPTAKTQATARNAMAARIGTAPAPAPGARPPIATPAVAVADSAAMSDLMLTPEPYYYESVGRRDLFRSLVSKESQPETAGESSGDLHVVGILWAENDRFALVETADGRNRILREGDSIGDGTVTRVLPDRVIVHVNLYGTSRNVTLPLVEGGGLDESPRSRSR